MYDSGPIEISLGDKWGQGGLAGLEGLASLSRFKGSSATSWLPTRQVQTPQGCTKQGVAGFCGGVTFPTHDS